MATVVSIGGIDGTSVALYRWQCQGRLIVFQTTVVDNGGKKSTKMAFIHIERIFLSLVYILRLLLAQRLTRFYNFSVKFTSV